MNTDQKVVALAKIIDEIHSETLVIGGLLAGIVVVLASKNPEIIGMFIDAIDLFLTSDQPAYPEGIPASLRIKLERTKDRLLDMQSQF